MAVCPAAEGQSSVGLCWWAAFLAAARLVAHPEVALLAGGPACRKVASRKVACPVEAKRSLLQATLEAVCQEEALTPEEKAPHRAAATQMPLAGVDLKEAGLLEVAQKPGLGVGLEVAMRACPVKAQPLPRTNFTAAQFHRSFLEHRFFTPS